MPRRPSMHVDDPVAVGERLRAARHASGLTQRDLAFDGCTSAYVSRIEAGARTPSLQILREFGNRLGVTADYLATGLEGGERIDGLVAAEIALRAADLGEAERLYREARESADTSSLRARAEAGLGIVALARGDAEAGIELLEMALASDELPQPEVTTAVSRLSRTYCAQGRFAAAFALLDRHLDRARTAGDRFEVATLSMLLANAYVDSGDLERAETALGDALALARDLLDPMVRAGIYWSQSRLSSAEGRHDLAARHAQLAVATLRATEHTEWAARAMLTAAYIEIDRGNGREAIELLDEAAPVLSAEGDEFMSAVVEIERARALSLVGDEEEAVAKMLELVPRLSEARPGNVSAAYAAAGDFFRRRGDAARALELYELAVERAPARGLPVAAALTAMAEIHEEQGNPERALELLKDALAARSGTPVSE